MIFKNMIGKTMKSVYGAEGDEQMTFTDTNGKVFKFLHQQDCCESVSINDIVGNISDLIGYPLLQAEEINSENPTDHEFEYEPASYTWTFYKFATIKGYVTVRWLGESNGYYSEEVSYVEE